MELFRIIRDYGEDQFAKNIAKHIVAERSKAPIETTYQLNEIIKAAIPAKFRQNGHPSKKTFQAIRIECNRELDVLKDCVDIARTTPTACNRQPNKTYIITQKELISKIVNVQGGGRGFAEYANKILIVTSSVSVFNNNEVFEALKSGGMYAMNLLYALHSKRIGVCPLLWGEDIKKDNYLRKLINIPDNEEIIIIYACGYPTSEFKYVTSVRNDLEKSMVVV
jgi:nitroreductase